MDNNTFTGPSKRKSIKENSESKPRRSRRYTSLSIEEKLNERETSQEKKAAHKRMRRSGYGLCARCSSCCCVSTIVGTVLFLIGAAAVIVYLLTSTHTSAVVSTATTGTSTTSTTATTTTTTTTSECYSVQTYLERLLFQIRWRK